MIDKFEFRQNPESMVKRYRVIVPAWQRLLSDLSVNLTFDDISEINELAATVGDEETTAKFLDVMLQKVTALDDPEEQRAYIAEHQPLRAALHKAFIATDAV